MTQNMTIIVSNDTVLVEDPFEDVDEDIFRYNEIQFIYMALMNAVMIKSIVQIILGLIVIVVNILLIYVISKFKRLKTTANCYIRHYAISNVIYFVGAPLVCIVYDCGVCLEFKINYLGLILIFLFAFALGFDWLAMTFNPEIGRKIKNCYKFLTPAIYILSCVNFLVVFSLCYTGVVIDTDYIFLIGWYTLILLFIIILNYLNFRYTITSSKRVYTLKVANIIVLCWLPTWVFNLMYILPGLESINAIIFRIISFLPEWISDSISIIILTVLVKMDKHFRMAFAKLFRRSVRHYNQGEDSLDESEDNNFEPKVFYHKETTCVHIL